MRLFKLLFLLNIFHTLAISDVSEKSKKALQSSILHIKHAFNKTQDLALKYTERIRKASAKHGSRIFNETCSKLNEMADTMQNFVKNKLNKSDEKINEQNLNFTQKEIPTNNIDDIEGKDENIAADEDMDIDKDLFGGEFKELFEMFKKMSEGKMEGEESEQTEHGDEIMPSDDDDSKDESEKMNASNEDMEVKQEL